MMHHTSLLKFPISSTGDVITFNYFNGHTVEEVTEEKYEACEVSILQFFFGFSQGILKNGPIWATSKNFHFFKDL